MLFYLLWKAITDFGGPTTFNIIKTISLNILIPSLGLQLESQWSQKTMPDGAGSFREELTELIKYACSKQENASDFVKKTVVEELLKRKKASLTPSVEALLRAAESGNYLVLQVLLKSKYKEFINHQDSRSGFTPLHCTALAKSTPCALLLLQHGADPTLQDVKGDTISMLAEKAEMWPVLRYFYGIRNWSIQLS